MKRRRQHKEFQKGLGLRRNLYFDFRPSVESNVWYDLNDNLFQPTENLIHHQAKLKLWADIKYSNEKT